MGRSSWHILRQPDGLTLARRVPVRFDVSATTRLPDMSLVRLAHQMRQDIWRELRNLRGFSPVIELTRSDGEIIARAGGQIDGSAAHSIEARIAAVIENPTHRARWARHARRGRG